VSASKDSQPLPLAFNSVFEVSHWFDQCDLNSFERAGSRVLPAWLDEPPKENSMSEAYQSLTHSR
jgi:hypothetical protein